ncbi:WD40 YVTN repeat-like-containing domain,Bromodomain isoform [Micractinium conductrix]|uniref:WD40 YVTN repeat-like-containing domain,Bromodomain isoform n=1 Tax=Micractinium conductrix TaxID=554055 RepID=A0A2P6V8F8_9CHLO|nr:WD40 YVTN repeat-like-containing domain,Bromodomain isoform [Micractinium conductrix]|eukprot:PSC70372.1 WD40 YVTN repeat-like-containing domain,Bromodomain isoform [Micractinium conductrix]
MEAPGGPPPAAEAGEVLFLIAEALQGGPFAALGAALAEQAAERGLLPRRHDVHGASHTLPFDELRQRYTHLPPNALQHLLSQLLARRRDEAPQPAARSLTSLLECGSLAVLPAAAPLAPPPPRWLRPGASLCSEARRLLLLRAGGLCRAGSHPGVVAPTEAYARQLSHVLTVRGHRFAVYCVCYDRSGRFIVTGSDDRLVKIWSTVTGLLQASCRGHDAEITDLSVSADNSLMASSSMDGTVRVWQLGAAKGRPGLPVSVLAGHAGPAAFVDFHPTLPDALLSASFDGTCRIWRARDAAAPPVVLRIDPTRFGLSGAAVTRLGGLAWPSFAGPLGGGGGSGLEADGMRTTRNMERQLLGLLGQQPAGPAGASAARGASAPAAGRGGAAQAGRHSGRATRNQRSLADQMDEGEEEEEAAEEEEEDGEAAAGAAAGGEGVHEDGAPGMNGLLVCGFSRDGTHIVAGGNDCSVYVWQWEVPGAAPVPQQRRTSLGRGTGTPSGPAAAAAGASPAMSPAAAAQQQQQQRRRPVPLAELPEEQLAPAVAAAAVAAAVAAADGADAAGPSAHRPQEVHQPPAGAAQQQQQQEPAPRRGRAQRGAAAAADAAAGPPAPWPLPKEICQLKGHRNDIILLQFSNGGDHVATGSKDGSVRVWSRPRRWRKRPQAWEQLFTFAVLPDPEAIKEARRRRRPPPAPSVDQIAWSADDQRLCVSITDHGVRVLGMPRGDLLHTLAIHTNHVHILECHPTDPSLAFSASYDGTLALWNLHSGAVLRRFTSRQTRPDGRSWPDLLPLSDGHFSPDGASITVSDVAGQMHQYTLGARCALLARAPYDQFFSTDYNPLLRDLQHNVLDAVTQLPPHVLTGAEAVCDALGNPYPEPLQAAYRAQRVLAASAQEAAWLEAGKEPGYLLAAPTLTAASWAVEQVNGTEHAMQLAIARAQERLTVHEDRLNAGASAAAAREAADEAGRPRDRRERAAAAAWAEEAAEEGAEGADASSGDEYLDNGAVDSDEDVDSALLSSEEDDEDSMDDDDEADGRRRGRGQRGAAAEPSRQSTRLAGRRGRDRGRAAAPVRPAMRRRAPSPEEDEEDAEHDQREEQQRADREARAERRRAVQQERLAEERHRRQRQAAARRRAAESSDEDEEISEMSEDEQAGPSRQPAAQRGGGRRRGRDEMEGGEDAAAAGAGDGTRSRKRQRRATGGWRPYVNYAWLSVSAHTPGVYVPQAGDAVVYLREGHQKYLDSTNDKRPAPWQVLRGGRGMRPAEPCTIVDVHYVIANDGSDHTLAQLTLSLTDAASSLKDTCFTVEVPPPIAGHAEFVVHRSRFEASVVQKCWEVGDQTQVYWNDDGDDESPTGAGLWWLGTIVSDQRDGRHADVLADPFGAGGLWDRFGVAWLGVVGVDGDVEERQADNSLHCPWELFTPGTTSQAALQESPSLDAATTQRMLAAVEAASKQDRFVIFVAVPEYDEMYVSKTRRSTYYNRLVGLPLALHQVGDRLRAGYYRQPAALAGDIATIASNAAAFNGEDSEIAEDAAALAGYLTAVLQGQEPDIAAFATYPEDQAAAAEAAAAEEEAGGGRRRRRATRRRGQQEEEEEEGKIFEEFELTAEGGDDNKIEVLLETAPEMVMLARLEIHIFRVLHLVAPDLSVGFNTYKDQVMRTNKALVKVMRKVRDKTRYQDLFNQLNEDDAEDLVVFREYQAQASRPA